MLGFVTVLETLVYIFSLSVLLIYVCAGCLDNTSYSYLSIKWLQDYSDLLQHLVGIWLLLPQADHLHY